MTYHAAPDRYDVQPYRRCGRSGLKLPAISLGFWHNFGDDVPYENQRAVARRAFDLGVTHFDLANNYGPPYGAAESNVGRMLGEDFASLPRRAGDLDQGRLGHVGRPVRRLRLPQVPHRQPRPVAAPPRSGLRRHLLPPPSRPGHAAGGDDGGAGRRRTRGQGALRRRLVLLPGAHRRGRGHPARPGHADADPPALLLHVQPVGRGRPAGRAGDRGRGLHRLHRPRPGAADQPLSRRRSRRLPGRAGQVAWTPTPSPRTPWAGSGR